MGYMEILLDIFLITACVISIKGSTLKLWTTCDDRLRVYIDGIEHVDPYLNYWNRLSEAELSADAKVLALECKNVGNDKGIVAALSNGKVTNANTWKCNNRPEDGWTMAIFNDTHWSAPISFGEYSVSPWGRIFGNLMESAHWIWHSSSSDPDTAYCRTSLQTKIGIFAGMPYDAWFITSNNVDGCCQNETEAMEKRDIVADYSMDRYIEKVIPSSTIGMLILMDVTKCYGELHMPEPWDVAMHTCTAEDSQLPRVDSAGKLALIGNLTQLAKIRGLGPFLRHSSVWEERRYTPGPDGYAVYKNKDCSFNDISKLELPLAGCAVQCDIRENCKGFAMAEDVCYLKEDCPVQSLHDDNSVVVYLKRTGLAGYTLKAESGMHCFTDLNTEVKFFHGTTGDKCAEECDNHFPCTAMHYSYPSLVCAIVVSTQPRNCFATSADYATYVKNTDGYHIFDQMDCPDGSSSGNLQNAPDPESCITFSEADTDIEGFVYDHTKQACYFKSDCVPQDTAIIVVLYIKKKSWYFMNGSIPSYIAWGYREPDFFGKQKNIMLTLHEDGTNDMHDFTNVVAVHFICEKPCTRILMVATDTDLQSNEKWKCDAYSKEWPIGFNEIHQQLSTANIQTPRHPYIFSTSQKTGVCVISKVHAFYDGHVLTLKVDIPVAHTMPQSVLFDENCTATDQDVKDMINGQKSLSFEGVQSIWATNHKSNRVICSRDLRCKQDLPEIPFGEITYPDASSVIGTFAKYSCNWGYGFVDVLKEFRYCLNDNTWNGEEAECRDIKCPNDLDVPPNGTIVYAHNVSLPDSTAEYICDDMYFLKYENDMSRLKRTCVRYNTWTGSTNRCVYNCTGEYRKVPGNIQSTGCVNVTSCTSVSSSLECIKLACDEVDANTITFQPQTDCCTLYNCQNGNLQLDLAATVTELDMFTSVDTVCPAPKITGTNLVLEPSRELYTEEEEIQFSCISDSFQFEGNTSATCHFPGYLNASLPMCIEILCDAPENVTGADLLRPATVYRFRDSIEYICTEGHSYNTGDLIHQCGLDSQWTGTEPTCEEITCDIPTVPEYSRLTLNNSGDIIRYGEEITYECLTGYEQLSGDTHRQCQSENNLSGTDIICAKVKCGSLPSIANTIITVNTTGEYKDSISYECAEGYKMIAGSTTRECTKNKQWTGSPLTCEQKTCGSPPSVENTMLTVQDTSLNSIATYSCKFGYKHTGGTTKKVCSQNESWTNDDIQCSEITCDLPEVINNATYIIEGQKLGNVATYSCKNGYKPTTGLPLATCDEDGIWTKATLVCNIVDCSMPNSIPNAMITIYSTTFQSTVTYTCKQGFSSNQETSQIVCGNTGQWSDSPFTCTPVDCGEPPSVSFTDKDYNSTTFNSYAFYSCSENYDLVSGTSAKICKENGQWSDGNLYCVNQKCEHPSTMANGQFVPLVEVYFVDSSITYSCDSLFYMVGDAQSKCQSDGTWSNSPKCLPIVCPAYIFSGDYNNTQLQVGGYHVGDVIRFSCSKGYNLSAVNAYIECDPNGVWAGSTPFCVPMNCGLPPNVPHSQLMYNTTIYKSRALYTCDPGYETSIGRYQQFEITCLETGFWDDDYSKCILWECPPPILGLHLALEYSSLNFLSTATYSCNVGYGIVNGLALRTCQQNKSWSGSTPACQMLKCDLPPSIDNTTHYHKYTTYGSEVRYSCLPDYKQIDGDSSRFCSDHALWNGTAIQCLFFPDDSKYEIELPEANLTAQQKSDAKIGFTKSDRVPTNFWTGSIVGSVFIALVVGFILILDAITIKKQWLFFKKNLKQTFIKNK